MLFTKYGTTYQQNGFFFGVASPLPFHLEGEKLLGDYAALLGGLQSKVIVRKQK